MGNMKKGANEFKIWREWRKGDGEWIYKEIFSPNIESFVCNEKLLPTIEKWCIYKRVNKKIEELCSPEMLVLFTTWHVTSQEIWIFFNIAVSSGGILLKFKRADAPCASFFLSNTINMCISCLPISLDFKLVILSNIVISYKKNDGYSFVSNH